MSTDHREIESAIISAGGKIEESARLPDGSGFMTASFPLRKDHWIYETDKDGFGLPPPMPFRMGDGEQRRAWADKIRAAGRYAVRASTMNGKTEDFDPDAMLQNFVVGMLGYFTADGSSGESWSNPDPLPPICTAAP